MLNPHNSTVLANSQCSQVFTSKAFKLCKSQNSQLVARLRRSCAGRALHGGLCDLVQKGCAGGCAWVVRRLSVRTEACRYFSSIFTMTPYDALALSITYLYFYSLLLILLPITTPSYSNLEHVTGLCSQGWAQGCAQGPGFTTCTRVVRFLCHRSVFL